MGAGVSWSLRDVGCRLFAWGERMFILATRPSLATLRSMRLTLMCYNCKQLSDVDVREGRATLCPRCGTVLAGAAPSKLDAVGGAVVGLFTGAATGAVVGGIGGMVVGGVLGGLLAYTSGSNAPPEAPGADETKEPE